MTQHNEWTCIGRDTDLVAGAGVGARFGDRQVAIFYIPELEQPLYAVDNYCPISGVNIIARGIVGDIEGEPVVATPLYKKHFSLLDGRCVEAPDDYRLNVYAVRLAGNAIEVSQGSGQAATVA
ncbi:nitrite reductase small subunit NirD [Halomonadaceae bacterium KBTZ08]